MPDLDATQRLVWELLTAPEGVRAGAEALAARGSLASADLGFLVRGDSRLDPIERLDIYANMYFFRLRDALAEDFPKLLAVLGGVRFHNLITDYLLACPSTSWTLRDLGRRLPDFLEEHALAEELPFAADLARLEWARLDVFDEADAEPLTREAIAALGPDRLATFALGIIPALRIVALAHDALAVWAEIEHRDPSSAPATATSAAVETDAGPAEAPPVRVSGGEPRPVLARVWRRGLTVRHREIPPDEARALELVRQGTTLPELAERLAEPDPATPAEGGRDLARQIAACLDLWTADGILMRLPRQG
jgi:hypothetical protein